jgi:hypothetical protein
LSCWAWIGEHVQMSSHDPHLRLIAPSASPEEAAAVVAALERFIRATAPPPAGPVAAPDPWARTATLEAVERESDGELPDPWLAS